MIHTPDLESAAVKAMEILTDRNITETPINALSILLDQKNVRVVPFTKVATDAGIRRRDLVPMFDANQDAATFHMDIPDAKDIDYIVVYNMRLPHEIIRRGIARELGHILLGHDGATRTKEARFAEAMCFAHHLLSPRPIIRMLQESGPITMNILTQTVGCSDDCVDDMQKIPGVRVPKELNQRVKNLFLKGIREYIRFHNSSPIPDRSPILDLGTYMDLYEE